MSDDSQLAPGPAPQDTGPTIDSPPPTESPQKEGTQSDAEAFRAELDALRAQVATTTAERDALATQAAENATRVAEAQTQVVQATRKALLAEHRGAIIDQLVQGNTVEELEASVAMAKTEYDRVAAAVRAQVEAERPQLPVVPPGASPRAQPNPEDLSPLQKLTMALGRNGGG